MGQGCICVSSQNEIHIWKSTDFYVHVHICMYFGMLPFCCCAQALSFHVSTVDNLKVRDYTISAALRYPLEVSMMTHRAWF